MKKFSLISTLSLITLLATTSCSDSSSSFNQEALIKITNSSVASCVYSPSEVEVTMTMKEFEENMFYNTQVMPSLGDVNILVVPVLIPEYTTIDIDGDGSDDKDQVLEDLDIAFFGEKGNSKLGYESLHSFYYESSYGKLNIQGEVLPWLDLEQETNYTLASEITSSVTQNEIVDLAYQHAKDTLDDDLSSFDSDRDGFIDAIWLIYSAPNYSNGGPYLEDMNYWAYTYWINQGEEGDVSDPIPNPFSWASYDFMYESYGINQLDAHTFIHETGHLLGLNDYYSTDSNGQSYSPLGKVDMMDNNIIDHNLYTKMLLGWTKPTLVYGSNEINLKSMQNEDSLIILQSDQAEVTNEFNPFSEYIVVELYTSEGLNSKDSTHSLNGQLLAPKDGGVRIYHIDKRLWTIERGNNSSSYLMEEFDGSDMKDGLVAPITNSRNQDSYNINFNLSLEVNLYDEIRLIERSGVNTFSQGGYQTNRSYFKDGDSFSMSTHSSFFVNGDEEKFDNGDTFSYRVEVEINE